MNVAKTNSFFCDMYRKLHEDAVSSLSEIHAVREAQAMLTGLSPFGQ